jgi:hypothetical protein
VASSASREESEEMYSGVSSVPKIFFMKQIKARENKEGVKREITHESKKQVKGKLTLKWCASLGCYPP